MLLLLLLLAPTSSPTPPCFSPDSPAHDVVPVQPFLATCIQQAVIPVVVVTLQYACGGVRVWQGRAGAQQGQQHTHLKHGIMWLTGQAGSKP